MILNSPYISGSLTVTGNTTIQGQLTVTGSLSGTASLASNALLLQGTGSTGFATTGSINEVSASQQSISASLLQVSASYIALSGSYNTFSGSASTRITENSSSIQQVSSSQQQISSSQQQISASLLNVIAIGATTGSNSFRANQSITGSLTVTGQIVAQSINIQQVTSSIIYSSGSNVFGCDLNSRQTFTGSVLITGSLTIAGASSATSYSGATIYGSTAVCSPVGKFTTCLDLGGALTGTSATFANRVCTAGLTVTDDIYFGIGAGAYEQMTLCYSGYNSASPITTLMPKTAPGSGAITTMLLLKSNGLGGGAGCNHMGLNVQSDTYLATCNGNVGIGTTTPATALHVSSSATQITLQNSAGGGNARRIGMYMTSGDTFKILSLCDNNNTRVDNILVANVLNGNVGILCSSPGFTLDVNGSLNVCTSTGAQISLINYGGSSAKIRGSKGTLAIEGCGAITLETNGANERVRVNVNGETAFSCQICALSGLRFGIGATTLNYFEEGCWQPVLRDSNNSTIANDNYTNSGRYTRIGNRVFFSLYSRFNLSGVGSGDGGFTTNLRISLPFTACSTAPSGIGENFAPINISYWSSFYCLNSGDFPSGYIRNGENNAQLTFQNTGCLSEFTFGTSRLTRSASGGIMMAGNYYAS